MSEKKIYKDLNELEYSESVIRFLRTKHDKFIADCFLEVVKHHKAFYGKAEPEDGKPAKLLTKTAIKDYRKYRPKYDSAFLVLESQGFIEGKPDGVKRPYQLTVRGLQLAKMIIEEQRQNN